MIAEGSRHRLRIAFPPSYVLAGSTRVTISGPSGERAFEYEENGYQALWRAIERVVRGEGGMPIALDTALDDLHFALELADAADPLLEVEE